MNWTIFAVVCVLVVLVSAVGVYVRRVNQTVPEPEEKKEIPQDCCGAHAVCERDMLLSKTDEIIYFDDEELDELAGVNPDEMDENQRKMIAEVFYTLREQDVVGWLRSLQLRNIELPQEVREEALFIVSERRQTRLENYDRKD